jgi:hypothetical protein
MYKGLGTRLDVYWHTYGQIALVLQPPWLRACHVSSFPPHTCTHMHNVPQSTQLPSPSLLMYIDTKVWSCVQVAQWLQAITQYHLDNTFPEEDHRFIHCVAIQCHVLLAELRTIIIKHDYIKVQRMYMGHESSDY